MPSTSNVPQHCHMSGREDASHMKRKTRKRSAPAPTGTSLLRLSPALLLLRGTAPRSHGVFADLAPSANAQDRQAAASAAAADHDLLFRVDRGGSQARRLSKRRPPTGASRTSLVDAVARTSRREGAGGKRKVERSAALAEASASASGGTSTISDSVSNLVRSIVGAGALCLPAGIAEFGDAPSALIPAFALMAGIGLVSAYSFSLLGRVCARSGAKSYGEAWGKTVGNGTSWIPALSCTIDCVGTNVALSMILADTFKSLLKTVGMDAGRTPALLSVTILVLLPLCLFKNLSSLAPFSLLGTVGMAYTAIVMAVRYVGGDYSAPDGRFLADLPAEFRPTFGAEGASGVFSPSAFILISMLSTAYLAHFIAPQFYNDLKDNTVARYNKVISSSFSISVVFFAAVSALGFLTFGSASSGLILNNYSTKDGLMSLSRVMVAASIVFSYPLYFVGSRDGLLDLANVPEEKRTGALVRVVTIATLAVVTLLAIYVTDLSLILSLSGATLGNALVYIYPAFMLRSVVEKMGDKASALERMEVKFAIACALLGVGMGLLGTKLALEGL